ncbi:MAG: polymer-forming cytoskeletal protein [Nitrospinae bacterium]|nr:polymer-forming cytoskeletal protein [Nitrospinota bacterium]
MLKSEDNSNQEREIKAFLGKDTEFKGVLTFEKTVRIDGKFGGEVITKDTLIVGEKALLDGDISVGTIIIKGKIYGNINATKRIEICCGGEILGNIKTPALLIEDGAIFEGNCEMIKKDKEIVQK